VQRLITGSIKLSAMGRAEIAAIAESISGLHFSIGESHSPNYLRKNATR
jgi:hypothetical protein